MRLVGARPIHKLSRIELSPEAQEDLARELVSRGLERGPKGVRVPLDEQILSLVSRGGRLPLKDVPKRVYGAERAEITAAIHRLVRAGQAHVIVRTQTEVIVGGRERVLGVLGLAQLEKIAGQIGKVLKKVRAKGMPRTLLWDDLTALLGPLSEMAALAGPLPTEDAVLSFVIESLKRLEDPRLKLVSIPELVRSLAGSLSMESIHRALESAAKCGVIELRPEVGSEFLKPEDARLCPAGPRGTVLFYARRVSP